MAALNLLIATGNQGKLAELSPLLRPLEAHLCTLTDLGLAADCLESGDSFLENSRQKAFYYHSLSGLPCLADDSGLEVDSLGGAPGIHSSRFGGLSSHQEKRAYLLERMAGVEAEFRTARFVCVASYFDGQTFLFSQATTEGYITLEEQGSLGFGYDPVFSCQWNGPTFAQISLEDKNLISHRARAFTALIEQLQAHLQR
jgi:XTP/dITP diphosphohydrolase